MSADIVLSAALADAARRAFTQVRAAHPAEEFYCFALFTSGVAGMIEPTCSGEQGLREAAQDYVDANGGTLGTWLAELRWSPADSPYYSFGDERFAQVQRLLHARPDPYELDDDAAEAEVEARLEACFDALAQLDGEGFFGRGAQRDRVLVTVLQGDQSDRSRLANARRLNPPAAVERLVADLQIPAPVGRFTTLGSRAVYQITALAHAPAAGLLAACGSGGERFAWDLDGRRELLATTRGGEHWDAAVSADGRLLAVTDASRVLRVDVPSGARSTLLDTAGAQVCAVAVSPDGATVIASSHDGVVRAFAAATGRQRWQLDRLACCLRFAPDGRLLALAHDGVALVDAADGSIRQELLPAAATTRYCLAWSPDGRALATGDWRGSGRIQLWRWQNGWLPGPALTPPGTTGNAILDGTGDLAFSPNGALLASAHSNGNLHLWDTVSGRRLQGLRGRQEAMTAVVFIDDHHVAAAGRDVDTGPPVYIWDL